MGCCKIGRKRRRCIMTCLALAVVVYTCRQLWILRVVLPGGSNVEMDILLNDSDTDSPDSCSKGSLTQGLDKEAMEKFQVHDLLRKKKPDFLAEYKNPCWRQENTGELNCLPYFYLAGFAKCGTTFAFQTIFSHPDTAAPVVKESHWLSKTRFRHQSNILEYLDVFAPAAREIDAKQFHHQITGDGSASTVWRNHFWANLPGNYFCTEPRILIPHYVYHLNPSARVIIMFRDPTERMISAYNHFDPGTGSAEHFHECMEKQTRMYTDCFARFSHRACAYNETLRTSASQGHHCQLVTGLYHVFIRDWLTVFPRDQILTIKMEDMRDDFYNVFAKIFKFLGLSPLPRSVMEQRDRQAKSKKRSKRVHMLNKTRQLLDDFYRSHNIQLTKLINETKHTGA